LRSENGTDNSHGDGKMDNRMPLVRNDDIAHIALVDQFFDLLHEVRSLHMILLMVAMFLVIFEIALSHADSAFLFYSGWHDGLDTTALAPFRLLQEEPIGALPLSMSITLSIAGTKVILSHAQTDYKLKR
jgi:hypothetical protein